MLRGQVNEEKPEGYFSISFRRALNNMKEEQEIFWWLSEECFSRRYDGQLYHMLQIGLVRWGLRI